MADTIGQIINDVAGITGVDPGLARIWVRDAGRRTMEAHHWSWLLKRAQFAVPAPVTSTSLAATVTLTEGDDEIVFSAAVADALYVGKQIRTASGEPIFDIIDLINATTMQIRPAWQAATVAGSAFEIFLSRIIVPSDCTRILSVVDPDNRWQLHLDVPIEQLDGYDPARSNDVGRSSLLAIFDYWRDADGVTGAPRFELYRRPTSLTQFHYTYLSRYPDLTDAGVAIPGALAYRGDIIREKALEFASAYAGTEDRPNPTQQINRRDYHAANWRAMTEELARQDGELFQRMVGGALRMQYAPLPWGGGDLQEYDPMWIYPDVRVFH